LQVVDNLLHALGGSSVTGGSLALVLVVDGPRERHSSVCGLDAELFALQPGIGAELGLDIAGKLRVIGSLGAAHSNR
jgi:hypothetical protein